MTDENIYNFFPALKYLPCSIALRIRERRIFYRAMEPRISGVTKFAGQDVEQSFVARVSPRRMGLIRDNQC